MRVANPADVSGLVSMMEAIDTSLAEDVFEFIEDDIEVIEDVELGKELEELDAFALTELIELSDSSGEDDVEELLDGGVGGGSARRKFLWRRLTLGAFSGPKRTGGPSRGGVSSAIPSSALEVFSVPCRYCLMRLAGSSLRLT